MLLSTHQMAEAERLCDAIGIILGGELIVTGTTQKILEQFKQNSLENVFFALAKERGLLS